MSGGIGVGRAFVLERAYTRTPRRHLEGHEVEPELARLDAALARADQQLEELQARLSGPVRETSGSILEMYRLMLKDPTFMEAINTLVRDDHINAEWAVRQEARILGERFEAVEDEYLRQRRLDLDFVAERVIRNLIDPEGRGGTSGLELPREPVIIVAQDLSPEDVIAFVQTGVVHAFVTDRGAETSHTSIVMRSVHRPAVVGVGAAGALIAPGDLLAVDGTGGIVYINPDDRELSPLRDRERTERSPVAPVSAATSHATPRATADGHEFQIHANVEFVGDVAIALENGADGIGLFRTEFLFLDREHPPDEEEQYQCYRRALELMLGRVVTIRTLDLGGDKLPGLLERPAEPEPAMGMRGIRYCLKNRELFRTQLRALLRASAHGPLRVMFPLISDLFELQEARRELDSCRRELTSAGMPVGQKVGVGIMVETPSAALMMDRLAQEVDFLSVGTNDLIQFLLAIDRRSRDVSYLYRPLHPSVLRVLEMVAVAARNAGIEASVCGEMAADPTYAVVLLALGFGHLSVPPAKIGPLREALSHASLDDTLAVLRQAMALPTTDATEVHIRYQIGGFFT